MVIRHGKRNAGMRICWASGVRTYMPRRNIGALGKRKERNDFPVGWDEKVSPLAMYGVSVMGMPASTKYSKQYGHHRFQHLATYKSAGITQVRRLVWNDFTKCLIELHGQNRASDGYTICLSVRKNVFPLRIWRQENIYTWVYIPSR